MFQLQVTVGSSVPIYRQIVDQIRHAAATGRLGVGQPLPSVRTLAGELVVNPNTIAKAYAALVRDGVLEGQQGRGYFIAERREVYSRAERIRRLGEIIDPFLAEAVTLGFTEQQVLDEIQKRFKSLAGKPS